jgi:hypothetical protein
MRRVLRVPHAICAEVVSKEETSTVAIPHGMRRTHPACRGGSRPFAFCSICFCCTIYSSAALTTKPPTVRCSFFAAMRITLASSGVQRIHSAVFSLCRRGRNSLLCSVPHDDNSLAVFDEAAHRSKLPPSLASDLTSREAESHLNRCTTADNFPCVQRCVRRLGPLCHQGRTLLSFRNYRVTSPLCAASTVGSHDVWE